MIRPPRRLSAAMLALFFRQLAVLVGSGIPLVQAWQLLLSDMPGACRPSLHLAALQMEQGVCPSQAMRQSQAFPGKQYLQFKPLTPDKGEYQIADGVVSADYNNKHFSSDAASPQEGEA